MKRYPSNSTRHEIVFPASLALGGGKKSALLTLSSLVLILAFTVSLGDLSFDDTIGSQGYAFLLLSAGKFSDLDVALNILLFLPFGFALAQLLTFRLNLGAFSQLVAVLIIALGLSYLVELLQVFTFTRIPSAIDVAANTIGALIGSMCYFVYARREFKLAVCLYASGVLALSATLQHNATLRNWDLSFPLLLGNERTGDRPWKGRISDIVILDRALSEQELAARDSGESTLREFGMDLLVSLRWSEVRDEANDSSDKNWPIATERLRNESIIAPIEITSGRWFQSFSASKAITQKLMKSSQFTLIVKAGTSDTNQRGPARIVSLSWNANNRNFTLGQRGKDAIFRLRTPITGENGGPPELIVPGIFANTDVQTLAVVYDGSRLVAYVDHVRRSLPFELTPGYVASSYLPESYFSDMRFSKLLFYPLTILPLVILLSQATRSAALTNSVYEKIVTLAAGLLFSFMLEGVIVTVSGKPFDYENIALSVISIALGMLLVGCFRGHYFDSKRLRKHCSQYIRT